MTSEKKTLGRGRSLDKQGTARNLLTCLWGGKWCGLIRELKGVEVHLIPYMTYAGKLILNLMRNHPISIIAEPLSLYQS